MLYLFGIFLWLKEHHNYFMKCLFVRSQWVVSCQLLIIFAASVITEQQVLWTLCYYRTPFLFCRSFKPESRNTWIETQHLNTMIVHHTQCWKLKRTSLKVENWNAWNISCNVENWNVWVFLFYRHHPFELTPPWRILKP